MWRERIRRKLLVCCCGWLLVAISPVRADPFVITELMAANDGFLEDDEGNSPDWLEIYNTSSNSVNIGGWSLTDDPTQLRLWTFPEFEMPAGAFLVVFASGKDRRDPSEALHTNFQLGSGGDFLALVRPDSTIATQFRPSYPPQQSHASFGTEADADSTALSGPGSVIRYHVPRNDSLGLSWIEPSFDDTSWVEAELPIGFDLNSEPTTLAPLISTDISETMFRKNASVYVRVAFELLDPLTFQSVLLKVRYADGFIVYLNGEEITRRNTFVNGTWRSGAVENRRPLDVDLAETIGLPARLLQAGENVLAFQAQNFRPSSLEFFLAPEVEGFTVLDAAGSIAYFAPTPGWVNSEGFPGIAPPPSFSPSSGAIPAETFIELRADVPGAEIRYSTDRTRVSEASLLYTEPILLDEHAEIRAQVYVPGFVPSAPQSGHYFVTTEELAAFSSTVPIVIVQTPSAVSASAFTEGNLFVIDPRGSRSVVSGPVNFAGLAGFKTRGSSSGGRTKKSMRLELRDQKGEDKDAAILDFPAGSDWILYGAFNFDQAHLRNPFMYELSNQVGRYAVRTQLCELFLLEGRRVATIDSYFGVYSLMESIKRGRDRVDVQELTRRHTSEPEITGGYIVKIDRLGPGDKTISVTEQPLVTVDPRGIEITNEQMDWFLNYMNNLVASLTAPDVLDPEVALEDKSYAAFLDPESWIDHHLLNVFSKNADALRLSTYLFKDRGRRVEFGPIWDFDRAMGSTDGRDRDPLGWDGGTNYFGYPWWGKLFADPVFNQRYEERWIELRSGPLATANFRGIIDRMAAQIAEAAPRDADRWGQVSGEAEWIGAVEHLKDWLTTRARWIDSQFLPVPEFSLPSGVVEEATQVSLSTSAGNIYYTRNLQDPRTEDDQIDPSAVLYTGPITVAENTRIRARTVVGEGAFSSLAEGIYVTSLLPLVVTEVMYAPLSDPDGVFSATDFEFVEMQNIGDESIELTGVELGPGPLYQFTGEDISGNDLSTLMPGEYVLVVKNFVAFSTRYDVSGLRVAGEFASPYDALSDVGEDVVLSGSIGEDLVSFHYDDDWYPSTRRSGNSLVIVDTNAPREAWNDAGNWRPSHLIDGSPGREDVLPEHLQRPGDVNQDGALSFPDVRALLAHLFQGSTSLACADDDANRELLDVNADTVVNLTDVIHILRYLFQSGPPPALGTRCRVIASCPSVCQ